MIKIRRFLQEQPALNNEDVETIKQLERILTIRKNRQQRLESQTRELRRNLAEKEKELEAEVAKANQFKQESFDTIASLRQRVTNEPLSVNDIFEWKHREVSLHDQVEKFFEHCSEVSAQKDSEAQKLNVHMQVYRQAVIDAEKISLIKNEVEEKQRENI